MKFLKIILLFNLTLLVFKHTGFAQKLSFDVVSFTAPKGWQKTQNEGGLQYAITDKKTGGYAIAIITKATSSDASANDNFSNDWTRLVKNTVQVNGEPIMQETTKENGWDIISGGANYTDNGNTGMVTLLTATGGAQFISVVLMTNAKQYQNDLLSFSNSLELAKVTTNAAAVKHLENTNNSNGSSIVGLWTNYVLETTGYNVNGMPQYTAGYLRKEYAFYADGSYLFRNKQWLTKAADITFAYETGTYSVKGNQLTLIPKSGKAGFWGKKSSSKEWGNLKKSSDYTLEKTTYTFNIIVDATYGNTISLQSTKPTARDGGKFNAADDPYLFKYSFRKLESLIDNPPGWKTGFEDKSFTSTTTSSSSINTVGNSASLSNSVLAGKIWEAKSYEKYEATYGSLSGFFTGGFWYYQYKFNTDGTYNFVYNAASALAVNPVNVLQYETGTYTINGSQITLTPQKGADEEWSTGKINNGMSYDHKQEVLEKRIQRLKSTARKLEKITYPFTVEYWQGNNANALCLKHTQNTIREGSPGQNNQSCFFEITVAKAENYKALFE